MSFPRSNLILDMLPPDKRFRLLKLLEPVTLPRNTMLYEPERLPHDAHFLTSGIASVVTQMEDGAIAEVGIIGREGVPQAFHLLGAGKVPTNCFMQVDGTGLRMRFRDLEREFCGDMEMNRLVLRFIQYQSLTLGQLSACNRLHDLEPRLARWLLMVQDRIDDPHVKLTHEFLGQMIGSRRSTVTVAAGTFQRLGLIEYTRGLVNILNRAGLEAIACECYPVTRSLFDDYLGSVLQATG